MIIDRRTFVPKHGQQDVVVDQLKKAATYVPFKAPYRIYTPQYGRFDVVVLEIEFKDLSECDRFWTGWLEKAPQEWWAEWFNLTENGGGSETFQLVFKS